MHKLGRLGQHSYPQDFLNDIKSSNACRWEDSEPSGQEHQCASHIAATHAEAAAECPALNMAPLFPKFTYWCCDRERVVT